MFRHYRNRGLGRGLALAASGIIALLICCIYLFCLTDSYNKYKRDIDLQRRVNVELERDMTGPSYRLWKDDVDPGSQCAKFETRFGVDIPRVWLASFPCSGNTWTRYLLEASTGIFSGSVFNDKSLYSKGFLGELANPKDGRTLTQKTHGLALYSQRHVCDPHIRRREIDPTIPTILLMRNPKRAIVSYWKFFNNKKKKDPHTAEVTLNSFKSKAFHKFVIETTTLWEEFAIDRLLWTEASLYIVHYEHLKENTTHQLSQLLEFLGVPIDDKRMECVSSHLIGSFKRKARTEELDPFTEEEKERMADSVAVVNRLMKLTGRPALPVYEGLPLRHR